MEISFQKVSIHVHPAFTPPYLFPIGDVAVTYTATDPSGNQASCTFHVKVIGKSWDYFGEFVKIQNPQKLCLSFIFNNFLFTDFSFCQWSRFLFETSLYLFWFLSESFENSPVVAISFGLTAIYSQSRSILASVSSTHRNQGHQ